MKPGGGKQKGAEFERNICKKLSLWVSHGKREDLFWRSAMSGGRATVGRKKGKDHAKHAGDISATHPDGHALIDRFYVETKFYADLNFSAWMLKNEGPMAGFWATALEQAAAHKLEAMMIVKQNRSEVFMIVPCKQILVRGHVLDFNPAACIARLHQAKADIFLFDGVMMKEFHMPRLEDQPFLKPGEIARILNSQRKSELDLYYKVDVSNKRIEGLKRRIAQGDEYADEVQDGARARAKVAKPVRIRG